MNKKRLIIPLERARIMLDIMNVLVEFHNIKFVHGDIKPENILSYLPENQHKLAGFRYTKREDEQFSKRAGGYLAPERRVKDSKPFALSFREDIFSLAMTLLKIEGLDIPVDELIPDTCFETKDSQSKCQKDVNKKVEEVFSEKNKLYPNGKSLSCLRPVFKKALSFDPNDRYFTVKQFIIDFLNSLKEIKESKEFFKLILFKEVISLGKNIQKQNCWMCQLPNIDFSSSWSFSSSSDKITFDTSKISCEDNNKIVVTEIATTKLQI